ncbi:MAG: hypothetical protein ACFE9L_21260 [Candidatus Hodarchaeota archaeon]
MSESLPRSFSLKIEYSDIATENYELRKLILRQKQFESTLHIILKVLSYIYFWDKELIIEPNFRYRNYRPDLIVWRKGEISSEDLVPDLWIECKRVKLSKIFKLARGLTRTMIVWIHKLHSLEKVLKSVQRKQKYKPPVNVQLIGINASAHTWNYLSESFSLKLPHWRIICFDKKSLKIFIRDLEYTHLDSIIRFIPFSRNDSSIQNE